MKINYIHLESTDSTNSYAREYVLAQHAAISSGSASPGGQSSDFSLPLLVDATYQTAGRGRYGHSFLSPAGTGIYMSYAYEREYTEEELLGITTKVAELILPVLKRHYVSSGSGHEDSPQGALAELQIKPINDIYIGDPADPDSRKVAGILTERVDYPGGIKVTDKNYRHQSPDYFIIVGIGINCWPFEVPDELKDIIGFLEPDCSMDVLIEEITEELMKL